MDKNEIGWKLDNSYLKLPSKFYREIDLNPTSQAELVLLNKSLAESIGLKAENLKSKEAVEILSGNRLPKGGIALAQAYAGHQFGNSTMLGDGRAMLIGEQITPDGNRLDIQLKGSGRTPYSRGGDGRASLRAMLREYLISEAIYNLGIASTRGLAVTLTGDKIIRESRLDGAVLTRIARSHIRVGTFEYAVRYGKKEDIKALADYTIDRHYEKLRSEENPYLGLLKKVIEVQALLISKWQQVAFIHGVMNTDNMTISGETIDYGPCAFMDRYDPKTVFSSIDRNGRYSYGNQDKIGEWNLARFAETLLPLIHEDTKEAIKLAEGALGDYRNLYNKYWLDGMRDKLGIFNRESEDRILAKELLDMMEKYKSDYTNTFIALTFHDLREKQLFESDDFKAWKDKWENRLKRQEQSKEEAKELMKKVNPAVIARNNLVEEALDAVEKKDNYDLLYKLLDLVSRPYDHGNIEKKYRETPEIPSIAYKTYCGT